MDKIEKKEVLPHTILIIKDGSISLGDLEELKKDNRKYVLHSKIDGIACIDYDKFDLRPFVKDILNRQGQFIEIFYLKFILFLSIFIMILNIIFFYFSPGRSIMDGPKTEILGAIQNIPKITTIQSPQLIPQTNISSNTINNPNGLNINHRNIQNSHNIVNNTGADNILK